MTNIRKEDQSEHWVKFIPISSLWCALLKEEKEYNLRLKSSKLKNNLGLMASIGLTVTAFAGGFEWKKHLLKQLNNLVNVWQLTNTTFNNVTNSCMSYIQSLNMTNISSSNCTVTPDCDTNSCPQIGNISEVFDCKAVYNNISDSCDNLKHVNIGILIAFLICPVAIFFCARNAKQVNEEKASIKHFRDLSENLAGRLRTSTELSDLKLENYTLIKTIKSHLINRYHLFTNSLLIPDEKSQHQETPFDISDEDGYHLLPEYPISSSNWSLNSSRSS